MSSEPEKADEVERLAREFVRDKKIPKVFTQPTTRFCADFGRALLARQQEELTDAYSGWKAAVDSAEAALRGLKAVKEKLRDTRSERDKGKHKLAEAEAELRRQKERNEDKLDDYERLREKLARVSEALERAIEYIGTRNEDGTENLFAKGLRAALASQPQREGK